jgi:nitrite reductase/ring-hydroxylating ferredoxin subunit
MSEWVKAIAAADLVPGACLELRVAGTAIALFNVGGAIHALTNTCMHRGGPLGQGLLDGQVVMCPWHAWTFDVTTGVSTVNPELQVQRYEVKVEDGDVFVKLGPPAAQPGDEPESRAERQG